MIQYNNIMNSKNHILDYLSLNKYFMIIVDSYHTSLEIHYNLIINNIRSLNTNELVHDKRLSNNKCDIRFN